MRPADRLAMLAAIGVEIGLTADAERLSVVGPAVLVDAAAATLRLHRAELIDQLAGRRLESE